VHQRVVDFDQWTEQGGYTVIVDPGSVDMEDLVNKDTNFGK